MLRARGRPLDQRVEAWVHDGNVRRAPNHRFIKLHAHGCNIEAPDWFLNGGPFDRLLSLLEGRFADTRRYLLHYVTARKLTRPSSPSTSSGEVRSCPRARCVPPRPDPHAVVVVGPARPSP